MPILVEEPEDPYAMDVDYITLAKGMTQHRENLLCSVRHSEENHLSKHEGTPKKKKGNHSLPRNQRKKKSAPPILNNNAKLASFIKEHDISMEKALKLLGLFYNKHLGETTSKSDRDTSSDSPLEIETTTKQGITIPITLQPTEGGDKTKTIALVDSGAMICCININFARKMKWLLKKLWQPTLARNTDRTNNSRGLIQYNIQLTLQIDGRRLEQDFFATRLGQEEKVILGHP